MGVHNDKVLTSDLDVTGSTITLTGLNKYYNNTIPKDFKILVNSLLEHCLWYFVRDGGVPNIYVCDDGNEINLFEIFEKHMYGQTTNEVITILGEKFELIHIKLRNSHNRKHQFALCAANRLVKEENIQGKLPGIYQKIQDEIGDFIYTCFISSKFLDDNVRPERTSFEIAENYEGLFSEQEISLKSIREEILKRTSIYLQDVLEKNVSAGKKEWMII